MFTDPLVDTCIDAWENQTPLILSSLRRDFARATQEADTHEQLKSWWLQLDVHAPCNGVRKLIIDGRAEPFEHTSLRVDEDRHLRLVVYARHQEDAVHGA